MRADLPDDDIPRLKGRIDACLEAKGGETASRRRAAELGQAYLSLSATGRRKFLLTLAHDYGLSRETAVARVDRWRAGEGTRTRPDAAPRDRRRCVCCASSWACRRA